MAHAKILLLYWFAAIMIGCGEGREERLPAHYPSLKANINILDKSDQDEAVIVDGDTIKLEFDNNLTSIRLIGIDAFESHKNNKAYRQAYENGITIQEVLERGKEAKNYIKAQLSKRVDFYLEYDEDFKDRYKRVLAYVWLSDKEMLNMKIICEGYALPLTIKPNDKYADKFKACYEEAKAKGLGVWR